MRGLAQIITQARVFLHVGSARNPTQFSRLEQASIAVSTPLIGILTRLNISSLESPGSYSRDT